MKKQNKSKILNKKVIKFAGTISYLKYSNGQVDSTGHNLLAKPKLDLKLLFS